VFIVIQKPNSNKVFLSYLTLSYPTSSVLLNPHFFQSRFYTVNKIYFENILFEIITKVFIKIADCVILFKYIKYD
jgi:hypothetical protein